jgi:hypothetical protein
MPSTSSDVSFMLARKVPDLMRTITATLQADTPLARAGLERAAALANIVVVTSSQDATMSLRSAGTGKPHPTLDITIDVDRAVVTMTTQPSPATWSAIHALLAHLAETTQSVAMPPSGTDGAP